MIPFQITFQDFPESDALWIEIQDRIDRLERFSHRITRCEVIISCPHRHRHSDRLFRVSLHLFIPGEDIIISRDPQRNEAHRDPYVSVRDAFDAAERVLKEKIKKIRHEVKYHAPKEEMGKITKIFNQDGYGFLVNNNGTEYYFNEHSITNEDFDHLEVGQRVRFYEELGEKGLQASSMIVL